MENTNVQRTVLGNGIVLLSENIPHVRSVSVGVWVKTGSRSENPALCGVSHFIEHLLFKGTPTRSAKELAFAIDSLGGQLDAFTGREYTCFYARIMDEHLPQALELLADMVLNPSLDPKEMETERQVILEEIRTTEDTPDDYVHDLFIQSVWPNHQLGQSILGTNESITALSQKELAAYFKQHYYGENVLIIAAGNIEHENLRTQVEKQFKDMPKIPAYPVVTTASSPAFQKSIACKAKDLEQVHLCLGTDGIPYRHDQRYAAYVLNTILGAGMSSRLFQKIREEHGLAYSVYSYFNSYADVGTFTIYAGTSPETMEQVVGLILQELKTMKQTLVEEAELTKCKEQLKGSLMLGMESTTNRMTSLAKYEIYFDRIFTLDELLAGINSVTAAQIQQLSQELFTQNSLSLALVGPAKALHLDEKALTC